MDRSSKSIISEWAYGKSESYNIVKKVVLGQQRLSAALGATLGMPWV